MNTPATSYRILTALSFDETGARALQEACRIALRNSSAELHVVHAVAPSLAHERDGESMAMSAQLERAPGKIREYVERACAETAFEIKAHVRTGFPAQVVLQTAAELDADLLVLGTHQRGALGRLMLGSVAESVLREACCPVLIALPKSYEARGVVESIEPACPDCLRAREANSNPEAWCERHSRSRLRPHVYVPSDRPSTSVFGT